MDRVIFNFALLPNADVSREFVAASRAMSVIPGLEYTLGENSLPHVTVLQFAGREAEAEDLWRSLSRVAPRPVNVHFRGLAFERWRAWDGLWLRMKHYADVRDLQRNAAALLPDRTFENGQGDLYEPHATLAAWPKRDQMPTFPLIEDILERPDVALTPALGVSGPQFQFARRLF